MIAWMLLVAAAHAATHSAASTFGDLAPARERFVEAERALRTGNSSRFESLLATLGDYPLYPYLLYLRLERNPGAIDSGQVDDFLIDWADTPLAPRLRAQRLNQLARAGDWESFLARFAGDEDAALHCLYLRALIETGRQAEAYLQVEALWLSAHSQPQECDEVFSRWRARGFLTSELAWARSEIALTAGEKRLAEYLERFLSEEDRERSRLWRRVLSDPSVVANDGLFAVGAPFPSRIRASGLLELARRRPDEAARIWSDLSARQRLSAPDLGAVQARIALSYALNLEEKALDWLRTVPVQARDAAVTEWGALLSIRAGQWREALEWMKGLSTDESADERWQYWRARCLEELGRGEEARALYAIVASQRSYYGFNAADRLGAKYHLNHRPIEIGPDESAALEALPGVQRARELYLLERWAEARREWNLVTKDMDPARLSTAAALAGSWGWHETAISTAARAQSWDDVELRFPTPHESELAKHARAFSLEPAWVFAIARQESAFMPDARSPKGALGLMQIMPPTGLEIARSLQSSGFQPRQLLDADTNLRFGAYYLQKLLKQMDGHVVLATGAYNAGPRRVRGWLPKNGDLPADVWIETVPFSETRSYIRRVLEYTAVYEMRLGLVPQRLSARLTSVSAAQS